MCRIPECDNDYADADDDDAYDNYHDDDDDDAYDNTSSNDTKGSTGKDVSIVSLSRLKPDCQC